MRQRHAICAASRRASRSLASFTGVAQEKALARQRYLINPLSYLGTAEKAALAPHYRIRVGTHDPHTSFTMAMTLALKAMEAGCPDVDYEMVWDADHGPADYPGELLRWIGHIAKEK